MGVAATGIERTRPGPERRRRRRRAALRRYLPAYVLIAPAFLATAIFLYIPMAVSGYWSFTEFNGLIAPKWVGLANYADLVHDPKFVKSALQHRAVRDHRAWRSGRCSASRPRSC